MDSTGVFGTRKLRAELRISYIKMQVTFGIGFLQEGFNGVVCLSEILRTDVLFLRRR